MISKCVLTTREQALPHLCTWETVETRGVVGERRWGHIIPPVNSQLCGCCRVYHTMGLCWGHVDLIAAALGQSLCDYGVHVCVVRVVFFFTASCVVGSIS